MDTLVITANLGHLKAFRIVETPTRGRKLELVEELEFPEARGRSLGKFSDQPGRFPAVGGGSSPLFPGQMLSAEQEVERRLTRLVASRIETLLNRERPEAWRFAARDEIRDAILGELPDDFQRRVTMTASADLTKTPAEKVLSHFSPFAS